MKRRHSMYLLITVLLLIVTVFALFANTQHADICEHSTCDYCEEIVTTENAVNAALETHSECVEINCTTCVFIEKQIERLEKSKTAEHSCHAVVCDACARITLGKCLRTVFCTLAVFAVAYGLLRTVRLILKEKTPIERAFTLLTLKVRLNN